MLSFHLLFIKKRIQVLLCKLRPQWEEQRKSLESQVKYTSGLCESLPTRGKNISPIHLLISIRPKWPAPSYCLVLYTFWMTADEVRLRHWSSLKFGCNITPKTWIFFDDTLYSLINALDPWVRCALFYVCKRNLSDQSDFPKYKLQDNTGRWDCL